MTIQAVFREIQLTANKPFCEGCFPIDHFLPRPVPGELPGLACPKSVGAANRFAIHFSVLREGFDPRVFGEPLRRFEDAHDLKAVHAETGLDFEKLKTQRSASGKKRYGQKGKARARKTNKTLRSKGRSR